MKAKTCVITASGRRVCGRKVAAPSGEPVLRRPALGTATWIGSNPRKPWQHTLLLSKPTRGLGVKHRYVVASVAPSGPGKGEVMLFASDKHGNIQSHSGIGPAPGWNYGSIEEALRKNGYRFARESR